MANTYLSRTPSSASNQKTYTISAWFKLSSLTTNSQIFGAKDPARSSNDGIWVLSSGQIMFYIQGVTVRQSTQVLRDFNAWYHVVASVDTTQSTASDRLKIYLNGSQVTSFSTSADPTQNVDTAINGTNLHNVGQRINDDYFDGSMSHIHFIDGTAYAPTEFGETDATTGEWKINTSPSVTYGTNGFFILKNGNSVTDQSGNGNNFTVAGGTLTKTEDNPSNVFATANPNDVMKGSAGILKPTFSNGNLTLSSSAGNNYQTFGTIAVDTGKYYWETKATDCDGHRVGVFFGDNKVHGGSYYFGANAFYIHQNGQIYYNGANTVYMSSLVDGDIVGVALDRTNGQIYLHKNGQYADGNGNNDQTFANAVSISTKLGVTMPSDITYPFFDVYGTAIMDINFGNGFFGTTAVATNSGNGYAGAEGSSIFNYQPPTGYSALSTKGLNL